MDVDAERVTFFRSPNGDRAALRIEERHVEQLGRLVILALDRAFERVLCLHHDNVAGVDGQHRVRIGAVDVVVFALLGRGQFVSLPGLGLGHP